jgi:PKD repeat protein
MVPVADTGSIYSWNDVNAILINGSNIFEAVGGNGIFRSTNNGTSWTAVNTGIALQNNISINSLANVGNNIFAGTDGGVYLTTNNGASWHPINTGLTDTSIWSLACNGSYIFAGTSNYNGIWKRALSEVICSAYFSLTADTNTPHHYIAINNAIGVHPIKYVWSWGDGTHDTIAYPSHIYSTAGNYTICLQITDSTGCTNTYCDSSYYLSKSPNSIITVDVVPQIITGINLKELSNSIKVYPNPAINSVTIETQQQSTIEILNIQGQTMLQQHLQQGKINIDISRLTKGVYILRLNNNDKTVVTKIVKE